MWLSLQGLLWSAKSITLHQGHVYPSVTCELSPLV